MLCKILSTFLKILPSSSRSNRIDLAIGGVLGALVALLIHDKYGDYFKILITRKKKWLGVKHPAVNLIKYKKCIYLDYNATTPIFPEVADAMKPFIDSAFGNPSSPHIFGSFCRDAIIQARQYVMRLINASNASSIIFTSSGSECDNRAIDIGIHYFIKNREGESTSELPHIITLSIEHPAILLYLTQLEAQKKISLTVLPVNNIGLVNLADIKNSLRLNTALVTIMHSNNEIGTIQPIAQISKIIKAFNKSNNTSILIHSDAAQSLGKVIVDVQQLNVDLLSIVGHKFGASKGVGALYINPDIRNCCLPLMVGGKQEGGLRAGTECVVLIVGLGEACRIAYEERTETLQHMLQLQQRLIKGLVDIFSQDPKTSTPNLLKFHGPVWPLSEYPIGLDDVGCRLTYLPNTVSVSFKGILASELMTLISDKVACSAGSACHSKHAVAKMSAVLEAIQVPVEYGLGTLRLTFGRHTTLEEVDDAVIELHNAVKRLI